MVKKLIESDLHIPSSQQKNLHLKNVCSKRNVLSFGMFIFDQVCEHLKLLDDPVWICGE